MSVFKNVIVYRIEPSWSQTWAQAEEALGTKRFVPCGPSQEKSAGWTEPRGEENGPLVESIGGQWLLEYMIESKALPASVIRRKVEERAAQIEATTGRKPGKKEKRDLKEDVTHELLPLAFTKHARIMVWIDPAERRQTVGKRVASDDQREAERCPGKKDGRRAKLNTLEGPIALVDERHTAGDHEQRNQVEIRGDR